MKDIFYAQVIDNNDPDQAGKIKIKIPHIHEQVEDDYLPWAKAKYLFSGGSSSYGKSNIPEIGSLVWIEFAEPQNYRKPYYIADIHLNNFHPHKLFNNNVKSNITGFGSSYPDVKYDYYKNGVCVGVSSNSSNPEIFIYHPSKTQIYINKNGDVIINGKEITVTGDNVALNGKTIINTSTDPIAKPVEKTLLGESTELAIENLVTILSSLVAIDSITNAPCYLSPATVAALTAFKSTLATTILSQQNKNN